ncbi:MAG: Mfa1 family fimbria major subunit [Muribaculum sp.]|nr:Mfa1 family fimbria major subunit [Muribaculum sp.]
MRLPDFSNILTCLSILALLTAVTGCSDTPGPDFGTENSGAYLTIQIGSASRSRANPSGGEDGDGREPGIRHENEVSSLALFFYDDPEDKGLDADAATEFEHTSFIPVDLSLKEDRSTEYTIRLGDYKPEATHRIAVATNVEQSVMFVRNLGQLRQFLINDAWQAANSLADHDRFTMASASTKDGEIKVSDYSISDNLTQLVDGSKEHPYRAAVSVERTAARIDLRFNASQVSTDLKDLPDTKDIKAPKALKYSVTCKGADIADVYLTHAIPVNSKQTASWLMKHLTYNTSEPNCFNSLTVCADELLDGRKPTNYVVEPLTTLKGSADNLASWFGNTRADYIEQNYDAIFDNEQRGLLSPWLGNSDLVVTETNDTYDRSMTIAYVNENTQPLSMHKRDYMTGLLFRAVYLPHKVYSDAEAKTQATYSPGQDFWHYRRTAVEMDEASNLYFSSSEAATAYSEAHPEDVSVITHYKGGVCYYHLWLRHANTDADINSADHECCPMEYVIVRNNIYRVGVSFTGPGNDRPNLTEPETANSSIFVRKWNFRRQPLILM